MGFNSVFKTLQEVFPQVDVRILKAAAIEHSKDADLAVEFILLEALPAISGQLDPSDIPANNTSQKGLHPPNINQHNQLLSSSGKASNIPNCYVCLFLDKVFEKDSSESWFETTLEEQRLQMNQEAVDEAKAMPANSCSFGFGSVSPEEQRFYLMNPDAIKEGKPVFSDSISLHFGSVSPEELRFHLINRETVEVANSLPLNSISFSEDDDSKNCAKNAFNASPTLLDKALAGSSNLAGHAMHEPSCLTTESEDLTSLEKRNDIAFTVGSHQGSDASSSSRTREETVFSGHDADIQHEKIKDLNYPLAQFDSALFVYRDSPEDQSRIDDIVRVESETVPGISMIDSSVFHEEVTDSAEGSAANDIGSLCSPYENHVSRGSLENVSLQVLSATDSADVPEDNSSSAPVVDPSVEDSSSSTIIVTRSGQTCHIDLLEDAIMDAKNNKKILFSSMEVVINMMKEVELQEETAEHAKIEAASGGLDILVKVEDLKQMLRHAHETNDMVFYSFSLILESFSCITHAGEVYGEKSILATEARELQTRLLCLSDERDNSLEVLEEMRQKLEKRLEAAEQMRKSAEQEKLTKDLSAREALTEQELVMDKVVQESKRLQQEAEENSKLREFLMDRGHTVDILQGEISVICKDVLLVKEKFDGCIPFSKSLFSIPTSWNLASSGSSSSSRSQASDRVLEQCETSETLKCPSLSSSVDCLPQNINDRKVLVDDDWDLFDDADY
ncbi:hypothetical protein GIB67_028063 [Kingdonia uniflora]|uniref:CUE domain-containing protein n=1 Tax=Kingdonia uniflora TaxID=39325 RepID=A0A7J7L184_9MAGN|nr:hypothetical protein GIB67_028063 [Kingdonia uniflora]